MKYLKSFNEVNGANLTINTNPISVKFDGGDGPSATEIPTPYHQNIDDFEKQKGNNAKKQQELRRKKRKETSKEYRIAKMMDYQTDDDLISNFPPMRQPTSNAGGAT